MLAIQPQYLSLHDLLKTRLFKIPDYQRAYSWTSKQREDLFSDIRKTYNKGPDAGHFMAAVVCLRRDKQTIGTDEFNILDVVDGQQRLTTLILLLKAISLCFDVKNKTEKKIADELKELLIKTEADALLLLQTNHDSSHYFANFLRKGVSPEPSNAKTIADLELLNAISECMAFVRDWKEQYETLSLLVTFVKNRLYFLLHEIKEEQAVYTVFEVLNSRGLDVSWLDRLKSILMGSAFDLEKSNESEVIDELHRTWRDIYACIGLRLGMNTEALRFAATLKTPHAPSRLLSEEPAVKELHAQSNDAKSIIETAQWLLEVTKACDSVTANHRLNAVTRISQARLLAVAINLRTDLKKQEKAEILRSWENVSFRIFGMLRNDARTRVGEYVRLAWRIVNEKLGAKEIEAEIKAIGKEFTIEDAVENLRNTNRYTRWEHELRYFLFRYEEHLAKKQGLNFSNEQWEKIWMISPAKSIEHIWPQSTAPEKAVHRLGNLVLLPPGLNSKLQAKNPVDKANQYRQTGLLIAIEAGELIGQKWNSKSIISREDVLLEWALKEWAD